MPFGAAIAQLPTRTTPAFPRSRAEGTALQHTPRRQLHRCPRWGVSRSLIRKKIYRGPKGKAATALTRSNRKTALDVDRRQVSSQLCLAHVQPPVDQLSRSLRYQCCTQMLNLFAPALGAARMGRLMFSEMPGCRPRLRASTPSIGYLRCDALNPVACALTTRVVADDMWPAPARACGCRAPVLPHGAAPAGHQSN